MVGVAIMDSSNLGDVMHTLLWPHATKGLAIEEARDFPSEWENSEDCVIDSGNHFIMYFQTRWVKLWYESQWMPYH